MDETWTLRHLFVIASDWARSGQLGPRACMKEARLNLPSTCNELRVVVVVLRCWTKWPRRPVARHHDYMQSQIGQRAGCLSSMAPVSGLQLPCRHSGLPNQRTRDASVVTRSFHLVHSPWLMAWTDGQRVPSRDLDLDSRHLVWKGDLLGEHRRQSPPSLLS